jgi:hypothetical protein
VVNLLFEMLHSEKSSCWLTRMFFFVINLGKRLLFVRRVSLVICNGTSTETSPSRIFIILAFLLSGYYAVIALSFTLGLAGGASCARCKPLSFFDELIESIVAITVLTLVLVIVAVDLIAG